MAFESAYYFQNNNSFTFVFRFDDEEEAHFLTRWETTLQCASQPSSSLRTVCWKEEKKKKQNQQRKKKWRFLQDDVEIVAVCRCRLPRQDATEPSSGCRAGLFSAAGSGRSAVSVTPKLWKLVGIFLFMWLLRRAKFEWFVFVYFFCMFDQ